MEQVEDASDAEFPMDQSMVEIKEEDSSLSFFDDPNERFGERKIGNTLEQV